MTEPLESELRKLEQATAPEPLDESRLDPETAMLRESWSRLTQLLEAADEAWKEDDLVNRVTSAALASSMLRQSRKRLWISLVVAASVLVLGGIAWLTFSSTPTGTTTHPSSVAQANPGHDRPSERPSLQPAQSNLAQLSGDELSWDDTLDERLANLDGALRNYHRSGLSSDTRFTVLGSHLEQIAEEINGSNL